MFKRLDPDLRSIEERTDLLSALREIYEWNRKPETPTPNDISELLKPP